jgi:hypothetical protein
LRVDDDDDDDDDDALQQWLAFAKAEPSMGESLSARDYNPFPPRNYKFPGSPNYEMLLVLLLVLYEMLLVLLIELLRNADSTADSTTTKCCSH